MSEEFTLRIEEDQLGTPAFRSKGMYKVVVPYDPEDTTTHSQHYPKFFKEIWVDGGRYTGEKLRQIRRDGKHR